MCNKIKPFFVAHPLVWAQQYCSSDAGPLISFVGCAAQDAKVVLAEVRELKFALEESNEAAEHLQSELAAAQVTGQCIMNCRPWLGTPARVRESEAAGLRSITYIHVQHSTSEKLWGAGGERGADEGSGGGRQGAGSVGRPGEGGDAGRA